jgi:hypothetical protein
MVSAPPAADLIGIGLYTTDEAALYARLKPAIVNRWVFGDKRSEPVFDAQLKGKGEKLVTFLDFIQTLAIRSIRLREKKFPLQKIRRACDAAIERHNSPFPLAAKDHSIFLFGPKDEPSAWKLLILVGHNPEGENEYVQISGKEAGNRMITRVVEPFMQGVHFGKSPFVERYDAFVRGDRKVVMDPHVRFGEPYLPSCGYTARALWEAYIAEGGADEAAGVYGVDVEDVRFACSYFDYLGLPDAASDPA